MDFSHHLVPKRKCLKKQTAVAARQMSGLVIIMSAYEIRRYLVNTPDLYYVYVFHMQISCYYSCSLLLCLHTKYADLLLLLRIFMSAYEIRRYLVITPDLYYYYSSGFLTLFRTATPPTVLIRSLSNSRMLCILVQWSALPFWFRIRITDRKWSVIKRKIPKCI